MAGLILGQIEYGIGLLNNLRKRCQVTKRNHDLCEELIKEFNEVHEKLQELQSSEIPVSIEKDWTGKLDDLKSYFDEAVTTLDSLWSKLDSKSRLNLGVLRRASRSKEKLEKLMKDFEKLDSKAWLLNIAGMIMVEGRRDSGRATSQDSRFVPTFYVPENPSGVLVNFSDPDTLESALKIKVLDESSTVVGAVGAKGASAVAATGMGGVGKTSALRAIGADKEVQDHYNGGVYFFTLGQSPTSAKVISMVATAVKKTKGVEEAKEISGEQDVRTAIQIAANWFAGKRCLFICDDLWRTESRRSSYLNDLKALVSSESGNCILFSTRDLKIAEEIDMKDQVHFSRRSDTEAAAMLGGYAGFQENETYSNESFQLVLKLCCGLPIALAVAGRSVQRIIRTSRDRSLAWDVYKERLQEAGGEAVCIEAADDHEGLFRALTASLEEASKLAEFRNMAHEKPIQAIHRAFCVLRKQTWAPSSMLACLWGVEERKAEKIAEEMELLGLLSIERRELNQKSVLGVTLHDLVHDFCVKRAQENKEVAMWHAQLLDGYICQSKLSKENFEKGFGGHNWWSVRLKDDKYVHAYLTHHLAESGRLEELESVMLNFGWTYRQLKVNRFLTLRDDFDLFRNFKLTKKRETGSKHSLGLHQHDKRLRDKGLRYKAASKDNEGNQHSVSVADQIELVVGALRLSWSLLVSQKPAFTQRELAFQIMGRLCSLRCIPLVDEYLRSVERETEKPWANPVGPCLELPQGPTYGMFRLPGPVNAVSVMHAMGLAVAGDNKGNLSILDMKSMEIVRIWRGHEGRVKSVAVNGDGRRIVSGSDDGTVRIWNMETGEALGKPLLGGEERVMSVAVSRDGGRVVSGLSDGTVRIWDMETGAAVGEPLRGHGSAVSSVAVSGDGRRIVSGSDDRTVRIWDMETGEAIGEPLRGHGRVVWSVAVSGNGQRIVSGSGDKTVRIWDMETGAAVGEPLRGHEDVVMSVAMSRDGRRIVSGSYDRTVRIWNMETGEALGVPLLGHGSAVWSVALSGDGQRIVSGSDDGTVCIWNVEAGKALVEPLRGHGAAVSSVAMSGDGQRIVSGSWDGTVRMWNMETGEAIGEPLWEHHGPVLVVAVSGDGQRIVSGLSDGTVRIWNMETGEALGVPLQGHDRCIVSGSYDKTLRVWNMETREAIGEPLRGHGSAVSSVAVSGNGQRIVSGSDDGTVRIWDMEAGEAIGEPLRGHRGAIMSVAVSGDGQRIVSGSDDRTVRIWDMETGEAMGWPLRGHRGAVWSVAVSRDGQRIVSGSYDRTVRVWDTETGEAIGAPLRGHRGAVWSVVVSGDGQRIVSGSSDGTVRIWDMETGEPFREPLRGHEDTVTSVAVSEDGQWIVSGSYDRTVRIWNMETGEAVGKPLRGHEDTVTSVAVSEDGQRIVSGSYDRTVRIWNMETGEACGEPLRGHGNAVSSVAVSGDGQRIVSGSSDRTMRIWDMETGEVIGEPLERDEDSFPSVLRSGLLDEFIRREPGNDGARGEMPRAPTLTTRTFCITGHDGIFYGDIASGTDAMKIGSFESEVSAWLLDTEGKVWAGLANGTLAVVRTMK